MPDPTLNTGGAGGGTAGKGLIRVAVLGGGPDAERQVSLTSSRAVHAALRTVAGLDAQYHAIDRLTQAELRAIPGDVIFPVLHGLWGEGGQLQDLLERDGRPFVGSGARAARLSMDKIASKAAAMQLGIPTPLTCIYDPRDPTCPLPYPVIVKPVHEGSTIGLHVVIDDDAWGRARRAIHDDLNNGRWRSYMIEPKIGGAAVPGLRAATELTVGILDGKALPIIQITPAGELYDYEAKYHRDDTTYTLDPELPAGVAKSISDWSMRLFQQLEMRHLARADFMLDPAGKAWFLEINAIPGFTDHSLVPMAAKHLGMAMPSLCSQLVEMALRDAGMAAKPVPQAPLRLSR